MTKILTIFVLMAGIGVATNVGGCTIPPAFNNINNSALINSAMNNQEIWKDVEGYEGSYQVSNLGRVKSLERIVNHSIYGKMYVGERILKTYNCNHDEYIRIDLKSNGIKDKKLVHRLIAESFIPNPENKKTVNHKDGNKKNNNIDNLEWMTHSENHLHSYKELGRKGYFTGITGKNNPKSKPIIQLSLTGEYIKEFCSATEAEFKTGIFQTNISKCCVGKRNNAGGYIWKFKT